MPAIPITETLYVTTREEWREWLSEHHASAKEIWLIAYAQGASKPSIPYLHAVEEALCFGWIDSIRKKVDAQRAAQRFSPRRPRSGWTELNKERARRLIASGRMTPAGVAVLPDLTVEPLRIAPDIEAALQADASTWRNFQAFPEIYQRIRIAALEAVRHQPDIFQQRLNRFLNKTRQNKMIGSIE